MKTDTPKDLLDATAARSASPRNLKPLIGLVALVAIVAAPLFMKNFLIFQLTLAMIWAIAILGLNLLTGFNGQFSLGHGAFYAVGAYTTAILMEHGSVSYYWTIPAAGVICFIAGFLFGLPALRLEGTYLALATFALAVAMPQILKFSPFEHWTGGVQGIVILKPDAPFGIPINQDQWLFYFTLITLILMFAFAYNLVGSRTGSAIKAIRDNPTAAKAMGINLSLYKSLTFGVSALYTGIAGALSAIVVQFVAPDSFTFALSVILFVGLVIGGVGWIPGAFFGALFIMFVPHLAEGVSKGLAGAVFGIMLIAVIFLMPSGAAGLLKFVMDRLTPVRRWMGSSSRRSQ